MNTALTFRGVHAEILADRTPEIFVEGARNSGKTTVCLWKEINAMTEWPGIWSYVFRMSDTENKTKIRPELERFCSIRNEYPKWDGTELCYEWPNGSRMYCYGLKSVDLMSRYAKMRGMSMSRVLCSQAEEVPEDLGTELRAVLRPDPSAKSRQRNYPHQITFEANPVGPRHWLALQFPENNTTPRRRHYRVDLYQNAHNLSPDTIAGIEAAYPPDHPRFRSLVLGLRGPNITGSPIYAGLFRRELHRREVTIRDGQLIEAFTTGKNNPCWVIAQRTRTGALQFLGGIIGVDLFLTDFLPIVLDHRRDWFGSTADIKTCASPTGAVDDPARFSDMDLLRDYGFKPRWQENSNAPDVRLAMIEQLGDAMRHRTHTGEEALAVNDDPQRWLEASREGIKPNPFLAEGFEVGYVKDEHFSSVAHKEVRQPKADDWFEMGQRGAELLVQNFCAGKPTQAAKDAKARDARASEPREPKERSSMDWSR